MITIENEKLYKHYWNIVAAVVWALLAIFTGVEGEWTDVVIFTAGVFLAISNHFGLKKSRIAKIEISPQSVGIKRANLVEEIFLLSEIEDLPMNEFCARIDYVREGKQESFLVRDIEFTSEVWERVQAELKQFFRSPAKSTN